MALSVTYTNFGGMLVSENRGGTERQYVRDPLGSLVAEIDTGEGETYKSSYWPYGEVATENGSRQSDWGFVGLLGYFRDVATLLYVRARHYLPSKARWLTVDPLWPDEQAFQYVSSSVTFLTDSEGRRPLKCDSCPLGLTEGFVFIDCSCLNARIGIFPEGGGRILPGICGRWIAADAIYLYGLIFKIHGRTCVYISCNPDIIEVCCKRLFRRGSPCNPTLIDDSHPDSGYFRNLLPTVPGWKCPPVAYPKLPPGRPKPIDQWEPGGTPPGGIGPGGKMG